MGYVLTLSLPTSIRNQHKAKSWFVVFKTSDLYYESIVVGVISPTLHEKWVTGEPVSQKVWILSGFKIKLGRCNKIMLRLVQSESTTSSSWNPPDLCSKWDVLQLSSQAEVPSTSKFQVDFSSPGMAAWKVEVQMQLLGYSSPSRDVAVTSSIIHTIISTKK